MGMLLSNEEGEEREMKERLKEKKKNMNYFEKHLERKSNICKNEEINI